MASKRMAALFTAAALRSALGRSRSAAWVGALSFEDRCRGSLDVLEADGLSMKFALVLDYPTNVRPAMEDEKRRAANWQRFSVLQENLGIQKMERVKANPYSFQELQTILVDRVARSEVDFVIFDITCMTKIHSISLAAWLSQASHGLEWAAAYSTPENYGNLADMHKLPGWRDVIMAPLGETGFLFNEANSRGIVITGHEADRLIVALAELEPAGGVIVVANTQKRPDLRYMSERSNRKIVRQLTRMRSTSWSTEVVGIADMEKLRVCIARQVEIAKSNAAPIIVFPYGPKSLLFAASLQLASEYPAASWFVYPIPAGYDVDYSEGIESTMWLMPQQSDP